MIRSAEINHNHFQGVPGIQILLDYPAPGTLSADYPGTCVIFQNVMGKKMVIIYEGSPMNILQTCCEDNYRKKL